jgi:hypothetical protein
MGSVNLEEGCATLMSTIKDSKFTLDELKDLNQNLN